MQLRYLIELCLLLVVTTTNLVAATRPNVIVVLTDDQGYGDLSFHGNPVLKTPNLDTLARESIRLTDFHVAPMCTPTRGQLMTGVDALRNGAMHTSSAQTLLRQEFSTMPGIFAADGYRTALFGKWHLGDNYPYRPQDRGFQETIWFPSASLNAAADYWANDYFDDVYYHNDTRRSFKGYCTDVFFREATQWMRERSERKEPFFCYLPLNAPHAPFFVPDRYREPYRDQKPAIASFFGMIANIDENIGRLETFLRETGLRDNTIFIFMTDNGTVRGETVFNAGMRGKKSDLYEGGHRVPFFLRWPAGQLRASGDIALLTESQDVLPTLLDLCGLKKPKAAKFDGVSLAKLLRGKSHTLPDRMLVTQCGRDGVGVRKGDATVLWGKWRLVSGSELYDIAADPAQQRNVIERFPGVAAQMRRHYERWWSEVEPRVNDFSLIHIGSERESPSMLTPGHWRDGFLDQQSQIRRTRENGVWNLFVERDGDYEFSLRRWPVEANAAIAAGVPEYAPEDKRAEEAFRYRASEAWPIARAELKILDVEQSKPVTSSDYEIVFNLSLKRGRTELQTWFRDAEGKELGGAYYVYVRRKNGE
jgi:arylsulfatase A-like enzyme